MVHGAGGEHEFIVEGHAPPNQAGVASLWDDGQATSITVAQDGGYVLGGFGLEAAAAGALVLSHPVPGVQGGVLWLGSTCTSHRLCVWRAKASVTTPPSPATDRKNARSSSRNVP